MVLSEREIQAFTSSKNPNWETPGYIFDDLHRRFKFTVDGAANKKNAKLKKYWNDSLDLNWKKERVFINPPYGEMVPLFADKCARAKGLVVAILPCRPGTKWFQESVLQCSAVFYVQGRIQFLLDGEKQGSPLFDSVIALYNHPKYRTGTGIYLKPKPSLSKTKEPNRGRLLLIKGYRRYLEL